MRDRRVRVLHVVWRLSRGGGVPVVVRSLIDHTDPARFDLHVATLRPRIAEDHLEVLEPRATFHHLDVAGRSPGARLHAMWRVAALARRLRPDVLHLHSGTAWYGLLAARSRRVTGRVLEVHVGPGLGEHSDRSQRADRALLRRHGFAALVHSLAVRADVVSEYGLEQRRVRLVPLGVDTARYARNGEVGRRWRVEHGLADDAPIVIFVSRLVAPKDPLALIDVARRVVAQRPDVRFVLIGGGPLSDAVTGAAREAGLTQNVHLLGPRYGNDLLAAYQAASVFLSTSRYEGFGLAVLEAMASGVPVIATAVDGVLDLVQDGDSGFLLPIGDVEGMADCVLRLLADADLRARVGGAAKARASEQFDVTVMVDGFQRLYDDLAEG